jgi:stage V sporulation protein G
MKVTKVTIRQIPKPKGKVVAYVELEFDDLLIVRGLKIVNGKNGEFVAMPNKPSGNNDGKFYDEVYINQSWVKGTPGQEFSDQMQAEVLGEYAKMKSNGTTFEDQTADSDPGIQDDDVPF